MVRNACAASTLLLLVFRDASNRLGATQMPPMPPCPCPPTPGTTGPRFWSTRPGTDSTPPAGAPGSSWSTGSPGTAWRGRRTCSTCPGPGPDTSLCGRTSWSPQTSGAGQLRSFTLTARVSSCPARLSPWRNSRHLSLFYEFQFPRNKILRILKYIIETEAEAEANSKMSGTL